MEFTGSMIPQHHIARERCLKARNVGNPFTGVIQIYYKWNNFRGKNIGTLRW